MCGLTGFSSSKNNFDAIRINFLLYYNSQERGKDATGVFTPKSGVVKDITEAKVFVNSPSNMDKILPDTTMLAHVRAKTVGINTVANAHPFQYGNITLAHNGTLTNHWSLCNVNGLKMADYDVDSQVLAAIISKNFEDTPNGSSIPVLSQYEGAAALLFYNEDQDILYAYHDKERPLYYGYLNNGEDMYISSIGASLRSIQATGITEFPINTVHAIKGGKIIGTQYYKSYVEPASINKRNKYVQSMTSVSRVKVGNVEVDRIPEGNAGFAPQICIPEFMLGYWMRCDSNRSFNQHIGCPKFGQWYYAFALDKDKYNVWVRGEDKVEMKCYRSDFDTKDFIPVKGSFVVLMEDLHLKSDKTVKIASKGDTLLVRYYMYGDSTVYMEEPFNGETINCNVAFVRNASVSEIAVVKSHLIHIEDKKADEKKSNIINFDIVDRNLDVKNIEVVDDLPFGKEESRLRVISESDWEGIPAQDTISERNFVDVDDIYEALSAVQGAFEELKDAMETGTNTEVSDCMEALEETIMDAYQVPSAGTEEIKNFC